MLDQRSLQQFFQCLPPWMASYASLNLDTIPKIINHLLLLMAVCNFFLFFTCWGGSGLPQMGFSTVLSSFMLITQNVIVYMTFNNLGGLISGGSSSRSSYLTPNEFMVGICLGVTVGGCIVAFILSNYYHHLNSYCNKLAATSKSTGASTLLDTTYDPYSTGSSSISTKAPLKSDGEICLNKYHGNIYWISFWSGLVFWWNFCLSLLIAMGRMELIQVSTSTSNQQYESIGSIDNTFQQQQSHQTPGNLGAGIPPQPTNQGTFAGDNYSTTGSTAYSDKINITNG